MHHATREANRGGAPPADELLALSGLTKSYATVVLEGVDFQLAGGEVHALVGENGAGKSTLARIIAGLTAPNGGVMRLKGRPYTPASRADAERQGVRMVMQELNLVATLTVAESIFIEHLPHRWGWIDYRKLHRDAEQALAQVGLADLDPATPIAALGVGRQQLVEIAAGLSRQCDLFILDEPTAALTDPEIERLFEQIAVLKARGVGLIYISHRLEEIKRIADRLSVLRDGRLVATAGAAELSLDEIVRLMVGREVGQAIRRAPAAPGGGVALKVVNLRGGPVRGVSFEARRGEILGFAGLMGAGRTETMRLIFGADRPDGGEIYLRGAAAPAKIREPRDAVRQGLALLTENRKEQGLLLPLPVRENISLANLRALGGPGGWLRRSAETAVAEQWVRRLRIRCHSVWQRVVELSGGNQQKVVIAKWLYRDCDILIFDEPTRGIDVGARFEIYQWLADLAGQGRAVLVVSSDLKELMTLCDRLVVMSAGRVAAAFQRDEWTQDKIMAAALSGHLAKPPTTAN